MTWNETCPGQGLDAVAVRWLAADSGRAALTSPVWTSPVWTSPVLTSPLRRFLVSKRLARTGLAGLGSGNGTARIQQARNNTLVRRA
jgi:hypothetical protein